MSHTSELAAILSKSLGMGKSKSTFMSNIVTAFCTLRTVSLTQIVNLIEGNAQPDSKYRRLQRFFSGAQIDYTRLACFLAHQFIPASASVYLTIDRTNWQYGKKNINILMVGIVYKGTAIPFYWKMLDKRGNSNTQERIELMNDILPILSSSRYSLSGLLADREFIGEEWMKYLDKQKIPFFIRIKKNSKVLDHQGHMVNANELFEGLESGEARHLKGQVTLWGVNVYLSGLRLEDGEDLILASSEDTSESINIYGLRWEIETLFGCLKGRGFRFESTHITKPDRVKRMVAVLSIAFCWAHKTGEWQSKEDGGIKLKKHGRLAKSLFRHGLDQLQRILAIGGRVSSELFSFIELLCVPERLVNPDVIRV